MRTLVLSLLTLGTLAAVAGDAEACGRRKKKKAAACPTPCPTVAVAAPVVYAPPPMPMPVQAPVFAPSAGCCH